MNNYQINVNSLTVGTKIYVEGITTYSRLAKLIEGEELQKDILRKQERRMNPITKPYTTISIKDAKICPKNASALTLEEQYVQERFYQKTGTDPNTNQPTIGTYIYTVNSKSPYLPTVSQYNAENNYAEQVNLDGKELDTGLKVILCLSVYQPKNYSNKGIGLDGVIVMDPIRYYTANNNDLSALGLTYKPLPGDEARAAVTPHATNTTTQAEPQNNGPAPAMQPSTPMPPVQQTQQVTASAPTPVGGTPQVQQQVPTNPIQNNMNAPVEMGDPETPWICPSCGTTNTATQKFCGSCGNQKQANNNAVNNPYAQNVNPVQPTQGIVYEPNPTDRNY